ncbi:MAG: hypothetical protein ACQESN_06385 [Thermotogota bacterium]
MADKIPITIKNENINIEILSLKDETRVRIYKKLVDMLIIKKEIYLIINSPFNSFTNIITKFS